MAGHAQLTFVMTECSKTQIRLMGPNDFGDLAQVESFSILCSCIANLHAFQHDHPGYLEALQKTSGLNDTCCSDKFVFSGL